MSGAQAPPLQEGLQQSWFPGCVTTLSTSTASGTSKQHRVALSRALLFIPEGLISTSNKGDTKASGRSLITTGYF